MTFYEELSRRKVVSVGLVYLAGAWLSVEVISVLLPIFDLPLWIARLFIVVLALAFPIVIALTWIFDITPDGVRRTDPRSPTGRIFVGAAATTMIIGIAVAYVYVAPGELDRHVIAVMPCDDWINDDEYEHLPEGVADDIISRLATLRPIRVIARTTTWALRYQNLDAREIGNRVGARFVLTCSVRKLDDTLIINADLIDAKSNYTVETMSFQRSQVRVIDVLNEISVAVAHGMLREVLGEDLAGLSEHGTHSTDALDSYMRGRFHFNQMTGASHQKAIAYYRQAIDIDPRYAAAHVAIAESHIFLTQFLGEPPGIRRNRIMAELDTALDIDDTLAGAWAILGHARMEFDDDWVGALSALELAYERNPWSLEVNNYLRQYYAIVGPASRMLPYAENALKIDPLGVFTKAQLIFTYETMRLYDEAIVASDAAIDLDPNHWLFYWPRSWAYLWQGRHDDALQTIEMTIGLWGSDDNLDLIATRGMILGVMDRDTEAEAVLARLTAIDAQGHISPMYFVMVLAAMGRNEESLAMVERAHEEDDWLLKWVNRTPVVDKLRDEPRYKAVMADIGLSDEGYFDGL
ncbi:MAG: hypothetical protein ACE5F8_00265 [Woeseiaceae bacterium]